MGWGAKIKERPTGFKQIWGFWRHCCCRYGWYPLFVSLIITAALLLDIYSSFACEFIRVNIGFNPANTGWNQSTVNVGFFFYESGGQNEQTFTDELVDGCQRYSDIFEEQFINGDTTWVVTRVMAMISAIAGMVVAVTAWLLVFTPIPACFIWPGIMLPGVMLAFLAEGCKFLFFDTSICHASLWYPSGSDSLPRTAHSCSIGGTAYFVIAAAVVFFIALVMICLKAPERRKLKENYGDVYSENYMVGAQALHSESTGEDPESQVPNASLDILNSEGGGNISPNNTSMVMSMSDGSSPEQQPYTGLGRSQVKSKKISDFDQYPGSESFQAELAEDFSKFPPGSESFQAEHAEDFSRMHLRRMVSDDDELWASDSRDSLDSVRRRSKDPREELPAGPPTPHGKLDSLVHKVSTTSSTRPAPPAQSSDSDELIDKCFTELAKSFMDAPEIGAGKTKSAH